jgi:hypothetical protein
MFDIWDVGAMVVESPSTLKYEFAVVVAEAHFVIVHGRNSGKRWPHRTILCPWTRATMSSPS